MLYWAYSRGVMPFFYVGPPKLHLHRLDGSFNVGAMRPIYHSVNTSNSKVLGVVDLTRRAKCVVGGGPEACNSELHRLVSKSPRSKCWGSTEYVRVMPGFEKNFYKCRKQIRIVNWNLTLLYFKLGDMRRVMKGSHLTVHLYPKAYFSGSS